MTELPKVCELCGGLTPAATIFHQRWPGDYSNELSKAKRCPECWALETAIKGRLKVARKILNDLETAK
jgi:hypothetical protein